MTRTIDLSILDWKLTGWRPFAWRLAKSAETGGFLVPEVGPLPARLPGSVQLNLLNAGVIPDWNLGRNSLAIEWVEHRHWLFSATLHPLRWPSPGRTVLAIDVIDYAGWILLNGSVVGEFRGAHRPLNLDLTETLEQRTEPFELGIVFDLPPEGQGQLGHTSRAREAKPRFSFGWDWCVRFVPIGLAGRFALEHRSAAQPELLGVEATVSPDYKTGTIAVRFGAGSGPCDVRVTVHRKGQMFGGEEWTHAYHQETYSVTVDSPDLWWPQGEGAQALYTVEISVRVERHEVVAWTRLIGFKHVEWRPCEGAAENALPWLCVVNGRPLFLQGVNWTPVRVNYLDVTAADTRRLVSIYREIGCNLLRVWGGGFLESEEFYAACDEAGILVWQEFPLSSSGLDSSPPGDPAFLAELAASARHYIRSRKHHACLLQWCGGNELHVNEVASLGERRKPLTTDHPALAMLAQLVAAEDPGHRFLPTSPYGPRFHSEREEFGRGLHHNVHGPWGIDGFAGAGEWEAYWLDDDALFRGEIGVAGASRMELICAYAGGEDVWPPTTSLWLHSSAWWTQWDRLASRFEAGDPSTALAAYVDYTRTEQAEKLAFAAKAKKAQFPRCGGFLVWMGHDAFPCLANTSIIEFDGGLKPAALALKDVFRTQVPTCPDQRASM